MDTKICKGNMVSKSRDEEESWDNELRQLVQTLPKDKTWNGINLYRNISKQLILMLLSPLSPKCGTTWLKALTFSTLNRNQFARDENPLFTWNPHQLVRHLEYDLYLTNPFPDLDKGSLYKPRLLATHVPYASLPTSMTDSGCKIVYIARNPMDMFISLWFFHYENRAESIEEPMSLDEAFDKFCNGTFAFGPFFDHVLGYWKASQENPNKVLFLRYEDLKEDINSQLKSLAMFLGVPFTEEEEKQGVVEVIAESCSFEKLKELEVNKKGFHTFGDAQQEASINGKANTFGIPHKDFFRKGKVGDWRNHLTPSMVQRMEKLIQDQLDNSGLTFKLLSKT